MVIKYIGSLWRGDKLKLDDVNNENISENYQPIESEEKSDLFALFFGSSAKLLVSGILFLSFAQILPHKGPTKFIEGGSYWESLLSLSHYVFYFLHELFRDVGISFLVAVAIAEAIERVASKRRELEIKEKVKEVQENALAAVFNTNLPSDWLNFVRETLQGNIFYRSNMRVVYEIRLPSDEEKELCNTPFVVCTVTISFRVTNTSFSDEEYPIKSYVELPWEQELRGIPNLDYVHIDGKALPKSELEGFEVKSGYKHGRSYAKNVNIPGKSSKDIDIRLRQINYTRDTTTFTCISPSDSLHLHLIAPEGFQTYAVLKHPKAEEEGESHYNYPLAINSSTPAGLSSEGDIETGKIVSNDTWVATKNPCFPHTCVELSWVDKVSC